MTKTASVQSTKLACFLLSLALTASFTYCASVEWQSPNSASSPLIVNPGSYCLPLTILATEMFPWPLKLKSNDTRFQWQSGFVIPYQATYANDILGCAGSVAPGNYVVNFTLDNDSWSGPGLLYIQVSSVPIELWVDPITTISSGNTVGPSWNLVSLSPFVDMTVTVSLSNNQFSVSSSSVTFRPNSTTQGFTFSTNGNTKANSSATATFIVSGTSAGTYALSQAQAVVTVPGVSNQTSSGNTSTGGNTTNTTTGANTTTNTSTGGHTTTNTTSNTTITTTTNTTTSTLTSGSESTFLTFNCTDCNFSVGYFGVMVIVFISIIFII